MGPTSTSDTRQRRGMLFVYRLVSQSSDHSCLRQFGRLLARKERSTTDYIEAARESRRALHEYDMACADLEFAKKKRHIASVQLELARAGDLGIEYKPPENE